MNLSDVAPIGNRLYRRLVIGRTPHCLEPAGCQPAIQPITNRRYGAERRAGRAHSSSALGHLLAGSVLLLLLVSAFHSSAQSPPTEKGLFEAAKRAFNDKLFDRAETNFLQFVQTFTNSAQLPE